MNKSFIEILGWYGMAAIVLAYALVSFSFLATNSIWYQLLNGTGAVGIVVVSLDKKAYQPGVLNIIWALIAVIAIFNILR
ncbi:MAG: hypothetical protein NTU85_02570 [Candidatus Kaiserbacteria bacterium]|nr:hypothetical protein [Candidatus Kaiserbacteria bacterium]